MQKSRWQKIEQIFNKAVEMNRPERRRFIEEQCQEDHELCKEILILIEESEDSGEFLSDPIYFLGAQLLDKEFEDLFEMSEFGVYKLNRLIGRGGIGAVFQGEDTRLGRTVALKILPMILKADDDRVLRFKREAQIACSIIHSNVTQIYEFDSFQGYFFIAMEYVQGQTLRFYLRNNNPTLRFALKTVRQIAEGLNAAHKLGIIHRDIKPENIMLNQENDVKILDFGLAKPFDGISSFNTHNKIGADVITLPGLMMGTVAYMSPEQSLRKKLDVKTDIWSLGIILYEMLMGQNPFFREQDIETMYAIIKDKPAKMSVFQKKYSPRIFDFVKKCLEKEPEDRYNSVSEAIEDINRIIMSETFPDNFTKDRRKRNMLEEPK